MSTVTGYSRERGRGLEHSRHIGLGSACKIDASGWAVYDDACLRWMGATGLAGHGSSKQPPPGVGGG